jgi:hypothetical protein
MYICLFIGHGHNANELYNTNQHLKERFPQNHDLFIF